MLVLFVSVVGSCVVIKVSKETFFSIKSATVSPILSSIYSIKPTEDMKDGWCIIITGSKDMKLIFPCHYSEIIVFSNLTCSNHCIQITKRPQVRGLWTGRHPAVDSVTPVTVFPSSLTCSC